MPRNYTVRGRIIAEDQATPAVERAQGAFTRFGAFLKDRFVVTLGDIQRAVRGVIDIFRGFINAAAEEEAAIKKLEVALRGLGPAAGEAARELQEQAAALQSTTTAADDAIIAGQALVASFTDNVDEIKAATVAALDLAQATGTDLRSAFLLLGKAAAGETGTLGRYGIIIDENIPRSEKFAAAIAAINEQFGGQAAAAAETYAGRVEQLGNKLGDLGEAIGKSVTQNAALNQAFSDTSATLGTLQPAVERFSTLLLGPLVSAVTALGTAFASLLAVLKGPLGVVLNGLVQVFTGIATTILALGRAITQLVFNLTTLRISFLEFVGASDESVRSAHAFRNAVATLQVDLAEAQLQLRAMQIGSLELVGALEAGSLASTGFGKGLQGASEAAKTTASSLSELARTEQQAVPSVGQLNDGVERQTSSLQQLETQLARTTAALISFRAAQGQQVQQLSTEQLLDQGFTFSQGGTRINSPRSGGGSRLVRPGRTFEVRGGSFV